MKKMEKSDLKITTVDDDYLPMFPDDIYMNKDSTPKAKYVAVDQKSILNAGQSTKSGSQMVNLDVLKAAGIIPCSTLEDPTTVKNNSDKWMRLKNRKKIKIQDTSASLVQVPKPESEIMLSKRESVQEMEGDQQDVTVQKKLKVQEYFTFLYNIKSVVDKDYFNVDTGMIDFPLENYENIHCKLPPVHIDYYKSMIEEKQNQETINKPPFQIKYDRIMKQTMDLSNRLPYLPPLKLKI